MIQIHDLIHQGLLHVYKTHFKLDLYMLGIALQAMNRAFLF